MEDIRKIHLKRLEGRVGEILCQLTRIQLSAGALPRSWSPAVNAYRCGEKLVICVDLAGVDREDFKITVQGSRVRLRGRRQAPEPAAETDKTIQVLAMEIDYGDFDRELQLPCDINPQQVSAEQRNGLLWIYLPIRCNG